MSPGGGYPRELNVIELVVKDVVPGGAAELVLRYSKHSADLLTLDDGSNVRANENSWHLMVCGLNRNKRLLCTPPVTIAQENWNPRDETSGWRLSHRFVANGKLLLSAEPDNIKQLPPEVAATLGARPLLFPADPSDSGK
jgi:hypothetical protein